MSTAASLSATQTHWIGSPSYIAPEMMDTS
jgi:hypothetical protein